MTNHHHQYEAPDYIIVGAGAAGCVLANRLSADPAVRVLLLEAGGKDNHPFMKLPLAFMKLLNNPRITWGYTSEEEPRAQGRRIPLPRGKCLGGTSSINGMIYSRGHPNDYDEWQERGAKGWGWADVLPYFRLSESSWRGENEHHGASGPLNVVPIRRFEPLQSMMLQTAAAMGHVVGDDPHGAQSGEGFTPGEAALAGGVRASASRRYLKPAKGRRNLRVLTGAHVSKVIIENGRAAGVCYRRAGRDHIVHCRREVILSGGAYNSPQLLLLSGIGPADELRANGITPLLDLPGVGRNLQEHPFAAVSYALRKPIGFEREMRFDRMTRHVLRWLVGMDRDNALIPVLGFGFIRTREGLNRPDVKANVYPTRMDARLWFPGLRRGSGHALTIFNVLLRPESTGRVTLHSADPFAAPDIRLNLFENEDDLRTLARAIRHSRRFVATAPLADVIGEPLTPPAELESDEALFDYIRRTAIVAHHASGTCAMGAGADAVVDPDLRVIGINGLRVVDASVMPRVVGGNTYAPVVMIAEKAADIISGSSRIR